MGPLSVVKDTYVRAQARQKRARNALANLNDSIRHENDGIYEVLEEESGGLYALGQAFKVLVSKQIDRSHE